MAPVCCGQVLGLGYTEAAVGQRRHSVFAPFWEGDGGALAAPSLNDPAPTAAQPCAPVCVHHPGSLSDPAAFCHLP